MIWPVNPKVLLTADNVDGQGNALLEDRSDVSSWFDQGDVGVPFVITDPIALNRRRAYLRKNSSNASVRFDGTFSLFTSLASKTALRFLHSPAVFDVFVVLRKLETSIGTNQRSIFGAQVDGTNGLVIQLADSSLAPEGSIRAVLGSGGLITILQATSDIRAKVGVPMKFLLRCDGTTLSISRDFGNFETQAMSLPVGAPADASHDYSVGGGVPTASVNTIPYPLGADLMALAIYDRVTTDVELAALKPQLEATYGVGI